MLFKYSLFITNCNAIPCEKHGEFQERKRIARKPETAFGAFASLFFSAYVFKFHLHSDGILILRITFFFTSLFDIFPPVSFHSRWKSFLSVFFEIWREQAAFFGLVRRICNICDIFGKKKHANDLQNKNCNCYNFQSAVIRQKILLHRKN